MNQKLSPISDALGLQDQDAYTPGICNFSATAAALASLTASQVAAGAAAAGAAATIGGTIHSALNQPDIPAPPAAGKPPTFDDDATAARITAAQERAKDRARARKANVLTSPLGVLQQEGLQIKSLLGGGR